MSRATETETNFLLDRLRQGEAQAWDEFFRNYSGFLMEHALATLPKSSRAQDQAPDVCQTVFLTFLGRLRGPLSFSTPETLKAYLAEIVCTVIIDRYREAHAQRRDEARNDEHSAEEFDLHSRVPDPSHAAAARELWYLCADDISDDKDRWIVHDHACGRTIAEIAAILGESERAIDARHYRLLKKLRAKFSKTIDPA